MNAEQAFPSRLGSGSTIAVVIGSMAAGGAERVTAQLANAWASRGADVHIITLASIESDFYSLDGGVQRHALNLARNSGNIAAAILATSRRVRALRRVLRSVGPDVIVGMTTTAGVLSVLAGIGLGAKVIVEEHIHPPMLPVGRPWDLLRRIAYPRATAVVVLTDESLAWLNATIPRASGRVIPNPVTYPLEATEPRLAPASIVPEDRRILLGVGRLAPQKGFDLLVDAFAAVAPHHPDWDLVILGEGPERPSLERKLAGQGLTHRIRMPGLAGNIGDWYRRADIFVMSSRFEGFPMTLAEALAYGCAAVSYDCDTGPRDLIPDQEAGSLVRPVADVAALANALAELMTDEPRRRGMGRRALAVRERYSMERVLASWDQLLPFD